MPTVSLTPALRGEYERLFDACSMRPTHAAAVNTAVDRIVAQRARYESVSTASGVPWPVIAVIHNMERSLSFAHHLHNGDPLTARTVQVPAGRPKTGSPPFTWEASAIDALGIRKLGASTDWSLAGTLYQLEGYNGWGYRLYHPHVRSPYLWSFSNHYTSGKYAADGIWSETLVSKQCGTAVLLRRLAERGIAAFADQPPPAPGDAPLVVRYAMRKPMSTDVLAAAENLQRWLNTFPGVFVKVDGWPGEKTSDAWRTVTGRFLPGDPRG